MLRLLASKRPMKSDRERASAGLRALAQARVAGFGTSSGYELRHKLGLRASAQARVCELLRKRVLSALAQAQIAGFDTNVS